MGNTANGEYSTIGGGDDNRCEGGHCSIGGGYLNVVSDTHGTIGGGGDNRCEGGYCSIGGGYANVVNDTFSTIAGGSYNTASGDYGTIGGGQDNRCEDAHCSIGGGYTNVVSGTFSTIGGGEGNTASGDWSTIGGGWGNTASGDYSFAAGYRAKASHDGAFVWADSTGADFSSDRSNQFKVRAYGGASFTDDNVRWVEFVWATGRPIDTSTGAYLSSGGVWTNGSDRDQKEHFAMTNSQEVLAHLAELPITTWNYKAEDPSVRHMGPVAQDFYAIFGLGEDDTHIASLDTSGVALAAVQGVYELTQEQAARIELLENENAALRGRLDEVDARLAALEEVDRAPTGTPLDVGGAKPATLTWVGWVLAVAVAGVFVFRQRAEGGYEESND